MPNEYIHKDGRTFGTDAGSALDRLLSEDPDWRPADASAEDPSQEDGGQTGDGGDRDLDRFSRQELDQLAADAGVDDPDRLPNKQAVIDAIRDARAA